MLSDEMHEELAASSMREIEEAQADWDTDPLRWQQDPETYPWNLEASPDNEFYVDHPIQHPGDLFGWDLIRERKIFSQEFLDLLGRLHRVWIKDEDPRALKAEMMTDRDPDAPFLPIATHTEDRGRDVNVMTLKEAAAIKKTFTLMDLYQLEVVWKKVDVMVQTVADFLETQRELTDSESRWADWTSGQAASLTRLIARLREHKVETVKELEELEQEQDPQG